MADREVTATAKGDDGSIVGLAGPWGSRTRGQAVVDINHRQHRYFVNAPGGEVELILVSDDQGKHIRTEPDPSKSDILQGLPDI